MAKDPRAKLERVAQELERALSDNLVSLVVFGVAAREESPAHRPVIDLLMILRDASPDAVRPIAPTITSWVRSGHPAPLIFTEREWRDSTDVFPIEIEDMREAHRLLCGRDPFQGLTTTRADLRRELEREARGKLLQLRAEYAAAESDGRALADLLVASAQTFFILFRAALRASGVTPPSDVRELVRVTAETANLNPSALDWVLSRLTGGKPPGLKPHDPIGVRYVQAIEQLVAHVDAMGE